MEHRTKTLSKDYLTSKLFLDEIETIETILNGSEGNFKIKTEDYIFSTTAELREKFSNQKLTNIEITSRNPYISIEFKKTWVRLYCGSDDANSAGIFFKLDSILSKSSRKPGLLYSYYSFWIANILSTVITVITKKSSYELLTKNSWVIIFIWLSWLTYIRLFNSGIIIVTKKHTAKNFFARNSDQLILILITAAVTVIITSYFPALQQTIGSWLS
jgi:hypothetical protein